MRWQVPSLTHAWLLLVSIALTASVTQLIGRSLPDPPGGRRPGRLSKPRITPLPEAQWTDEHRQLIAKYASDAKPGNALKTLVRIPLLVNGTMPFQTYITRESSLSARQRELLILRTAWLLNNDYVWSEHAPVARQAGLTDTDLRRVASGPDASGWEPFDATLLRLVDQLFRNSSVTDATWRALSAEFDLFHLMDAVMTVTDFTTISLLYNSLGIQPDAWASDRIPADIPYLVTVPAREPRLTVARVEPLPGEGIAIGRTFAKYPKLAQPRSTGSNYVNQGSKLEPRLREILILRTGWNCQSEYEWAQHVGRVGRGREIGLPIEGLARGPDAPEWNDFERTLLHAADELYQDSLISDSTWSAMTRRFDDTMMMNAVITAANYRMVSMALNAFGVQLDPGDERFPTLAPSR